MLLVMWINKHLGIVEKEKKCEAKLLSSQAKRRKKHALRLALLTWADPQVWRPYKGDKKSVTKG